MNKKIASIIFCALCIAPGKKKYHHKKHHNSNVESISVSKPQVGKINTVVENTQNIEGLDRVEELKSLLNICCGLVLENNLVGSRLISEDGSIYSGPIEDKRPKYSSDFDNIINKFNNFEQTSTMLLLAKEFQKFFITNKYTKDDLLEGKAQDYNHKNTVILFIEFLNIFIIDNNLQTFHKIIELNDFFYLKIHNAINGDKKLLSDIPYYAQIWSRISTFKIKAKSHILDKKIDQVLLSLLNNNNFDKTMDNIIYYYLFRFKTNLEDYFIPIFVNNVYRKFFNIEKITAGVNEISDKSLFSQMHQFYDGDKLKNAYYLEGIFPFYMRSNGCDVMDISLLIPNNNMRESLFLYLKFGEYPKIKLSMSNSIANFLKKEPKDINILDCMCFLQDKDKMFEVIKNNNISLQALSEKTSSLLDYYLSRKDIISANIEDIVDIAIIFYIRNGLSDDIVTFLNDNDRDLSDYTHFILEKLEILFYLRKHKLSTSILINLNEEELKHLIGLDCSFMLACAFLYNKDIKNYKKYLYKDIIIGDRISIIWYFLHTPGMTIDKLKQYFKHMTHDKESTLLVAIITYADFSDSRVRDFFMLDENSSVVKSYIAKQNSPAAASYDQEDDASDIVITLDEDTDSDEDSTSILEARENLSSENSKTITEASKALDDDQEDSKPLEQRLDDDQEGEAVEYLSKTKNIEREFSYNWINLGKRRLVIRQIVKQKNKNINIDPSLKAILANSGNVIEYFMDKIKASEIDASAFGSDEKTLREEVEKSKYIKMKYDGKKEIYSLKADDENLKKDGWQGVILSMSHRTHNNNEPNAKIEELKKILCIDRRLRERYDGV